MDRRTFMQLTASGLAATASRSPLLAAAPISDAPFFPFGTHIYREPSLPLDQLREDMPLLKRLGFNMVKIQESWAIDEQQEGAVDLSKVLQVVSDARTAGLRVYFGVTMEQAPAWLWRKFPDAYLIYNTGQPHFDQLQYVIPADGKPGPCWHHPGAREAAIRFLHVVGREVGQYDNVLVWNVWQEIGFWPMRPGMLGFCYCPHSLNEFQLWLATRYGTVRKLNQTWKSGYATFSDAIPPRIASDLPPFVDFRFFMDDVYLPWVLRWKAEAIRQSDPRHRPVFAHADAATFGSGQQWRHAEALDFFGCSNYPAWHPFDEWDAGQSEPGHPIDARAGQHAEIWNSILVRFDYLRCATPGGRLWVAELQGGPIARGLQRRRVPDAADIQRWVLSSLAAGAQGLCFWNHRAEIFWREQFGFGLLELEGNDLPARAAEASRLTKAIQQHADLFAQGTVPPAKVAILVSEELYQFHNATFHEPSFASPADHLAHTIRGIYKSLWDEGIPVDFLLDTQLETQAASYPVLLFPFPVALKPDLVQSLCRYVSNGGILVSEACPGRSTPFGLASPGGMAPALQKLFGVKHEDLVMIREPNDASRWTGTEAAYGDSVVYRNLSGDGAFQGYSIAPACLLQSFTAQSAAPILRDGQSVAGCANQYGKGSAYVVGTLLGHATLSYGDARNTKFLAALLARHGVSSDRVAGLQRRRRVHGNQEAWFLFNTTAETIETKAPVPGFSAVDDLLAGPLTVAMESVPVVVEPMSICCLTLKV